MSIVFERLKHKAAQSIADYLARNGFPRQAASYGYSTGTKSGVSVSEASALNCSVVNACIRVISDPIGFLPLNIYERIGDEDRKIARNFRLHRLMRMAPNPWMTATTYRQVLQAHLLTHGNAYSLIQRRSGTNEILYLYPMDPQMVEPKFDGVKKTYEVTMRTGPKETWGADKVWHIPGLGFDGLKGYSVINQARESIGLSQAMEQYGASFFGAGGRVPYILKVPNTFRTEQEYKKFVETWREAYGTAETFHAAPILTGGAEYEQIGMKPEDAQLLASRQFQVQEIARWYKVSPHKLADLSRATFSNIEHLNIEFLTETLSYWLTLWEQSVWLTLLNEQEQDKYFAEFNYEAILRGDSKSQAEAQSIQIQNGLLKINEGRKMYNRPAVTGGDINVIQLNMQALPGQPELSSQQKAKGPVNAA